jgi:hypothetical protein
MRSVAAILYAVAVAVLVATALALAGGGLRTTPALLALSSGVITAACALWPRREHWQTQRRRVAESAEVSAMEPADSKTSAPSTSPRLCVFHSCANLWETLAIVAFTLFALRAFLWLVFTDGDAVCVLSPNNLGDLALHLTYIRHLASGVPFWPENPIFAHGPLIYPIGVDLLNALLLLAGVDALRGLLWVGLAGAALTGAALWRWGRGFALIGFLANGGLMGFAFFFTGVLEDFQAQMAWKSLPLALLVTQRGLLFALPAGLLLLASWRSRFFGGDARHRLPWLGEWLLYTAMPVFHLHTFLFLSVLLAAWFVTHSRLRKSLAALVGAAFLPATALTLLVTGMLRGASVLGWKAGWMWDDDAWVQWCAAHLPGSPTTLAALLFWPMNFGVLPIFVALLGSRARDRHSPAFAFVWPALLVFLVCCFVKFAPWEWDNTKLMLWSYLVVLPFGWSEVLARWPLWARVVSCFALFWSGFASLLGGLDATHTGYEIARRSELDGVAHAVRTIAPTARFAAHPTYDHPLLLVGRKVALGYPGHLWSHGLPYREVEAQLDALMNGEPEWRDHARALGVRYLFFGSRETEHYPDSTQPWKEHAAQIATGPWGELYDLAPSASKPF